MNKFGYEYDEETAEWGYSDRDEDDSIYLDEWFGEESELED